MEEKQQQRLIRRYYQYLKLEKGSSPNTIDAYMRDLDKFLRFLKDEGKDFLSIELEDVHHFSALMMDVGIHPVSLSRILSGVRSFYHFLVLSDVLEVNPTELLEFPKKPQHLPDVLSVEEIDAIEDAIDLSQLEGHRNKAIIETLFSCGLRVSELVNLKLSNLFLDEQFIKVEGKGSKQRLVPISEKAIHELRLYFKSRNTLSIPLEYQDYVFVSYRRKKPLTRVMVFLMIKELVAKAGIQKTVSPHTFRHSFATSLLEGGANLRAIQAMLGHESIATTQIYTHIDTSHLREEILEHHPRNRS
ncbi:MAG: tyrosine recombinase XerD [Bacteroidaceae bacterium]|jgi:integrase/recombinase XerD|nr:tyrosine recombinase XerD [Bacteroidaceae bacterium]MBR1491410.1 tyrosine recombinase XerD [Bacteroidaceae bacterium]MDY6257491.1 site-specific tyrosine recombinase/integron integrase [Bacteroidaceae bacterium]